jgi:hypothetical protein
MKCGSSGAMAAAVQWRQQQLCGGGQLGDGFCYIMIGSIVIKLCNIDNPSGIAEKGS